MVPDFLILNYQKGYSPGAKKEFYGNYFAIHDHLS